MTYVKRTGSTALALVLAASAPAWAQSTSTAETLDAEVISLSDWAYEDLYAGGASAEEFIDEMEVYDATGENIGDVEDVIIGSDGRIAAVVAEVGGFWDIGDTHVSIPWSEIEMTEARDGIVVPVTEENVDQYGLFDNELITAAEAEGAIMADVDDAMAGPRTWRATELIGDYVRLREADTFRNYGYVNDLILSEGEVAAVVIQPDVGYGAGYRAYPYYGYGAGYGWDAGSPYYDLPYEEQEVGELETFDYERLE